MLEKKEANGHAHVGTAGRVNGQGQAHGKKSGGKEVKFDAEDFPQL